MTQNLTLAQAPEHFFDAEEWKKYSALFPNREKALESLCLEPGFLTYMRHQVIELNNHDAIEARSREAIYQRGQALGASCKEKLIRGEIIATGLQPPSVERKPIPAELWNDLVPDFLANKAKSPSFEFLHIHLSKTRPIQDIISNMAGWIQHYHNQHGESLKKVLQDKAKDHFGKNFTTRSFDTAYKECFGRTRGRPQRVHKK